MSVGERLEPRNGGWKSEVAEMQSRQVGMLTGEVKRGSSGRTVRGKARNK